MVIMVGIGAAAAQETRIAAVVNEDMISLGDLEARIRLVLLSSQLPDSEQVRQRVAPQVLRTLIDEKLEMQEAKKFNVTVSEDDTNKAFDRLEQQNNMPKGNLEKVLSQHGIPRSTLTDLFHGAGEKLEPLWKHLIALIAASEVVQADEMSLKMQRPNKRGFVWTFLADDLIAYRFADSARHRPRLGSHPERSSRSEPTR